ncbi:DsrE family protein [Nitrosomonas supralitoralis]|uniref:Uncharacterized protein n=1 Tax=Nitrosomonas supralitoralis TaxID=2116706 RepID=A0A2P7NSV3_9PROT|nr:DsrE family protein [Nitrosomonas supralitoralis]PSJ16508.1 hypothetical protein C7H79_13010 [Nitrosomonas supralitoralis]
MQNKFLITCFFLVFILFISGISFMSIAADHKESHKTKLAHYVVIEAVSGDAKEWENLMNNTENILMAFETESTKVEIVSHGHGLNMLLKNTDKNPHARMQKLHESGVVFAACQNTMKRMNLTQEDLVTFAIVVDSGVAEVIRKQENGWIYISR